MCLLPCVLCPVVCNDRRVAAAHKSSGAARCRPLGRRRRCGKSGCNGHWLVSGVLMTVTPRAAWGSPGWFGVQKWSTCVIRCESQDVGVLGMLDQPVGEGG